jgi:hypothetical protein
MLSNSECSEDYDDDLFFECAEPTKNPWREEEIQEQKGSHEV